MAYVEYNKPMPVIEFHPDIYDKIRAIFIKGEKISVLCKYRKNKSVSSSKILWFRRRLPATTILSMNTD